MSNYKMLIDLSLCVGCGACAIACKGGNNTQTKDRGQNFNWADFLTNTTGGFPNTKWEAVPVRCNHCDDPLCVSACPVAPTSDSTCVGNKRKAMYKLNDDKGGLVLHDDDKCIGCRRCQRACPYSVIDIGGARAQWSAISYNDAIPHSFWNGTKSVVEEGSSSPAELVDMTQAYLNPDGATSSTAPPTRTKWEFEGGSVGTLPAIYDVREQGVVEKCYFCAHRTLATAPLLPYCVQACPANARMVVTSATLKDDRGTDYVPGAYSATSPIKVISALPTGAKVLAHGSMRKASFSGPLSSGASRPNTYYIGSFSKR